MRCLLEREQQGSTFIGEEIAIPHARLELLNKPLVAIGISKVGIYDPNSSNTARIMFLVLSPLADPNSHIKLLGIISKTASDSQWKSRVLRAADKKELLKILRTYP
jgi:two-component system sensor histidine kinase KdpD